MFWHMAGTVKTLIFHRFFKVFRYSGVLEGLLGTSWRPCWTILGPRRAQDEYKMDDFGQVGDLGGHLGAKMGPKNFQKNFRSRGKRETLDRLGSAGGGGVSSGRVRVGINPTRVGLLSVIMLSYTATAALGGAAPD